MRLNPATFLGVPRKIQLVRGLEMGYTSAALTTATAHQPRQNLPGRPTPRLETTYSVLETMAIATRTPSRPSLNTDIATVCCSMPLTPPQIRNRPASMAATPAWVAFPTTHSTRSAITLKTHGYLATALFSMAYMSYRWAVARNLAVGFPAGPTPPSAAGKQVFRCSLRRVRLSRRIGLAITAETVFAWSVRETSL